MKLHEIRQAVMYVSKFLAINLELDPPDCTGLGDDPEDVSFKFLIVVLFPQMLIFHHIINL